MIIEQSRWVTRYGAATSAQRRGALPGFAEIKCEKCGAPSRHKHHEDYSKPLDVTYLCIRCHRQRHKELGWGCSGRPKHWNFSKLPVGSFTIIEGQAVTLISASVHNHSEKTGERFKCFAWDGDVVVFRLSDNQHRLGLNPSNGSK